MACSAGTNSSASLSLAALPPGDYYVWLDGNGCDPYTFGIFFTTPLSEPDSSEWRPPAAPRRRHDVNLRDLAMLAPGAPGRHDVGVRMDQNAKWKSRITADPEVLVGKPVIGGTRIAVERVVELLADGWSEADILDSYPGLETEDIRACLAYAWELIANERVYTLTGT